MADQDVPTGYTSSILHDQPGVGDWRVTSWGPQAVFSASLLKEASGLLVAILIAAWTGTWSG